MQNKLDINLKNKNMRTPETIPENLDLNIIADELEQLQADKNDGRGISCVQTIITYLKRGDLKNARNVCFNEADKISSHEDIRDFLKEKLFKGVPGHPWHFTESL